MLGHTQSFIFSLGLVITSDVCVSLSLFNKLGILLSANAVYVIAFEEVLYHSGYGQYEKDMTYIGLAMQILSIVGLLVVGKWIDYTKTF